MPCAARRWLRRCPALPVPVSEGVSSLQTATVRALLPQLLPSTPSLSCVSLPQPKMTCGLPLCRASTQLSGVAWERRSLDQERALEPLPVLRAALPAHPMLAAAFPAAKPLLCATNNRKAEGKEGSECMKAFAELFSAVLAGGCCVSTEGKGGGCLVVAGGGRRRSDAFPVFHAMSLS